MEEQHQPSPQSIKICTECMRVNPPEEVYCLGCGSEYFDDLHFTPFWDSLDEYLAL